MLYDSRLMTDENAPWAGLGQDVSHDAQYNSVLALKDAKADWRVGTREVCTVEYAKEQAALGLPIKANTTSKAIIREDNGHILGMTGSRWNPLQNDIAFNWFQPFLDTREARISTAGVIDGGANVWILAELAREPMTIREGDQIRKFLLLSNPHYGRTATKLGFTPFRVWCKNTLRMATSSKESQLIRLVHSKDIETNLINVREAVNAMDAKFEATAAVYRKLAVSGINADDVYKYVQIVMGMPQKFDDIKTRQRNTLEQIVELAYKGMGTQTAQDGITYWDAYNGITEYLSYNFGRSTNSRMKSLWFGSNTLLNDKALQTAVAMSA